MYIIITGAGIVGFHIASLLAEGKHEVTVIDSVEGIVDNVRRSLDVKTVTGNAATPKVLKEAEVNRANLVIAITNNDETNMLICFLAKELGAGMTVARVRNPEYSGYFVTAAKSPLAPRKVVRPKTLGIDLFINPEVEAANEIMSILSSLYTTPVENFADGKVQIREFKVNGAFIDNKPIKDIVFPEPCVIAALIRSGELIPPGKDTVVKQGDNLYLVAAREHMGSLQDVFTKPVKPVNSVVIFGGGHIGFLLAEGLEKKGVAVKLIEEDASRCQELAARLERTTVLQGNATQRDFLIEQGVPAADAFVATTQRDELNILCALLAKNLGVPRNLVLANKPGYTPLAEAIGVDVVVSPLILTANKITHFILHGGAISASFIAGQSLEAIEFVTRPTTGIVQKNLSEAGLPRDVIAAAIVRDNRVILPPEDTIVQGGDHVLIISPLSDIPSVERLFK